MAQFGAANVAQDIAEKDSTSTTNPAYISAGRTYTTTWNAGLRWTGVTVPQGATITTAHMDIEGRGANAGYTIGVYAEDADNAAAFSSSHRPSQVTKTSAKVTLTTGLGAGQNKIDITSLIQEVVSRTGWSSSNAINIVMINESGGTGAGTDKFSFDDADRTWGGAVASTLQITYTVGGGGGGGEVAVISQQH